MANRFDEADESLDAGWRVERDLGRDLTSSHFGTQIDEAVHRLSGDVAARIQTLRDGLASFERVAGKSDPMLTALLAEALAERGQDDDEAWALADAARQESGDYLHVRPTALQAQALVLSRRGDVIEAERRAREGVEACRSTDFLWLLADCLMTLGVVQRAAAKPDRAREAFREALELLEAKEIRPCIERARAALEETGTG
jgi:Flp pilus assembly protein TadD